MNKEELKEFLQTLSKNDCLHPEWIRTDSDMDWLLGIINSYNDNYKEFTLTDKMNNIFNSGMSIRFQNVVRRKDGEWYSRVIWEHVGLPGNQIINSCNWWGFETIEEAVDDCLDYIIIQVL